MLVTLTSPEFYLNFYQKKLINQFLTINQLVNH